MDKHIKLQYDYANKERDLKSWQYKNDHYFAVFSNEAYHRYRFPTQDIKFKAFVEYAKKIKMLHNDVCAQTILNWFDEPLRYCEIIPGGYSIPIGYGYDYGAGFNNCDRMSYSV